MTSSPPIPPLRMKTMILTLASALLLLLVSSSLGEATNPNYLACKEPTKFPCGDTNYNISFPFWVEGMDTRCSYPGFLLSCNTTDDGSMLIINMGSVAEPVNYQVKNIDYDNRVLTVVDANLFRVRCPTSFDNATLNVTLFELADSVSNLTVYVKCDINLLLLPEYNPWFHQISCLTGHWQYSYYSFKPEPVEFWNKCEVAVIPMNQTVVKSLEGGDLEFVDAVEKGFGVTWSVGKDWCPKCVDSGGACGYNANTPDVPTCFCPNSNSTTSDCWKENKNHTKLIAAVVCAGAAVIITAFLLCFFCFRLKKKRQNSISNSLISSAVSGPSVNDPESGSMNYLTHTFSYEELQEATNGFDANRELGDGGFGTVYKGKLRDGRVVAVKRLYENNYKRVEQFVNEVEILSLLRHPSLVTLYGCTSRHSRELLLVYEFVPNGTVADHLHGARAPEGGLTWPLRLNIAIESADALAYLHAVEHQIIHRDVKTNNILLDNAFHVKVADFGLSRLFPLDVTHVSTLPQGTPGYVDPEYHQCYQLTDKSDVYSFGVVLAELISSKPAVDIGRHRHEINLANMAINRIQSRELEDLIDPGLGYRSDRGMEGMITQVAELAFRCLQGEKEMRPTMKEVLEELRRIRSRGYNLDKESDVEVQMRDDVRLLKNMPPCSPDSVTARWESRSTTPNAST